MRLFSFLPQLTLLSSISNSVTADDSPVTTTKENIQETLNLYAVAIDSKQFSSFEYIFTPDAFANYTGPLSNLTGRDAITAGLTVSVANKLTQHQLGTQLIQIDDAGFLANATTYFTVTIFGATPSTATEYVILFGLYQDSLIRYGAGSDLWKINKRGLIFTLPTIGNASLLA